jgi:hypothetical protein
MSEVLIAWLSHQPLGLGGCNLSFFLSTCWQCQLGIRRTPEQRRRNRPTQVALRSGRSWTKLESELKSLHFCDISSILLQSLLGLVLQFFSIGCWLGPVGSGTFRLFVAKVRGRCH